MPRFLVAEDDPDDILLLRHATLNAGIPLDLCFVENGMELLFYLRDKGGGKPDLVLLDLNMPCMDGRAALKEIRHDPKLAGIPVVVLTTSNNEEDRKYCAELKAAQFITKPNSFEALTEIIHQLYVQFGQAPV